MKQIIIQEINKTIILKGRLVMWEGKVMVQVDVLGIREEAPNGSCSCPQHDL